MLGETLLPLVNLCLSLRHQQSGCRLSQRGWLPLNMRIVLTSFPQGTVRDVGIAALYLTWRSAPGILQISMPGSPSHPTIAPPNLHSGSKAPRTLPADGYECIEP